MKKDCNQIILVKTNGIKAVVKMFTNGNEILSTFGFLGKNGLGKTLEGDNKTPLGIFKTGKIFGIEPNPGTKEKYIQINENMYWITDSNSKYYNELVEITNCIQKKYQIKKEQIDWKEAEHLSDFQTEYSYAIEIKYNERKEKNKGSAIFLHVINGKPTAGCVAIPKEDMKKIINNIYGNTYICIV